MPSFPADKIWEWMQRYIWIEGAEGMQLFVPNKPQRLIRDQCDGYWGEPGWFPKVKPRQIGSTVDDAAFMLGLATLVPGIPIMLGLPKHDGYYSKWRTKLERNLRKLSGDRGRDPNPVSGWPGWTHFDRERIKFRNGSFIRFEYAGESIESAGNFGQGETYAACFINELAQFKSGEVAAKAIQSMTAALRKKAAPVIIDSAPDADQEANQVYLEIVRDIRMGTKPGKIILVEWWHDPTNAAPVRDHDKMVTSYTKEERRLVRRHKLTPEQIAFRRQAHSHSGFSEARGRAIGLSQYPETVDGAFTLQQASIFPFEVMERLASMAQLNEFAEPRESNPRHLPPPRWGVPWREMGEGYLRIYKNPVANAVREVFTGRARYHLGADPSDGLPQSDGQGLWLLDDLGEVCVEGRLWLPPIVFAAVIQTLLQMFGAHGVIEDQKGELTHRYVVAPISLDEIRQEAPPEWWQLCYVLQQPCERLKRVRTSTGKRNAEIQGTALDMLCADPSACVSPEMLDEMRLLDRDKDNFIIPKKSRTAQIKSPDGFKSLGIAGVLWKQSILRTPTHAASTMRDVAARRKKTGRYLPAHRWN